MNWKTIDNPLIMVDKSDEFAKHHLDFATKKPPDELFHYTTGDSLLAIINTQYMFATERSFLNDPQEFQWGQRLFLEHLNNPVGKQYPLEFVKQVDTALQDKTDDNSRLFVLSLSANPDLLSQWRGYASNGEGFAVGIDGNILRDRSGFGEITLRNIDLDKMPKDFVFCYHLLPVIYEKQDQVKSIVNFIEAAYKFWVDAKQFEEKGYSAFKAIFQYRIKELLISFKQQGYKEEAEWRIVAKEHKNSSKIKFRNGRFGIAPYVMLNLSQRDNLPGLKLPLTSIWIGPNSPAKDNSRGIDMLCKSKSINAPLKYSEINYRT